MENSLYKRNYSLDIVRIIAVLAVVMIHSSASFVMNNPLNTNEFIFGNLFDSLSRIGVPLFLMSSGALFLDKNKEVTLKTILSKNIKNLAIIIITWSIIYSVVFEVLLAPSMGKTVDVRSIIDGLINCTYQNALLVEQ